MNEPTGNWLDPVTPIEGSDAAMMVARCEAMLARLSGSSLLITGAAGLIGRYLVRMVSYANRHQLSVPCRVSALDTAYSGGPYLPADEPGIEYVYGDVRKPADIRPAEYVIHGASIASPLQYRSRPIETMETNFLGTRNVLAVACQRSRSAVALSTSEVYGDAAAEMIPTPETYRGRVNQYGPRACYVESKRLAETLCFEYERRHATPVRIVRPFNVYGPGQALDDGRIIPDIMGSLLRGSEIVLYGDGKATRSFCYVADAVEAIFTVLLSDHAEGAYNVGNQDGEVSIEQLAKIAIEASGRDVPVRYARSTDEHYLTDSPTRRCPDTGRIRDGLGWAPRTSTRQGLERTYAHYAVFTADLARSGARDG